MTGSRLRALCTVAVISLMVSACGDGGSGSVASAGSTPPPAPPPAGANADLLGTLKSETFVNDAAQGSLTYPGSASAAAANATFVYNASTQSYAMTVGGKSQTFAPANIDAALTNSAQSVYEITNGNTTDSLTLTKPGTSGRFTYEYVGAAVWQSTTINSSSSGSGNLYAVAYGEPTSASAIPKTGQAAYAIDILGASANSGGSVQGMTGLGVAQINLASGAMSINGTVDYANGVQGNFAATGTLSSAGTFSGPVSIAGSGSGEVTGRLYGPAAQEIGGSFYTSSDTGGYDVVSAGAILGRTLTAPATTDTFANFTGTQTLQGNHASQYTSATGTDTTGALFVTLSAASAASAQATVTTPSYTTSVTFSSNSNVELQNYGTTMGYILAHVNQAYGQIYALNPADGLADDEHINTYATQYVRGAVLNGASGSNPYFDYYTFGFNTPAQAVPTSGFAGYAVQIDGAVVSATAGTAPMELLGSGTIAINFATGQVTAGGTLQTGSGAAFGSYSGTGTLGASAGTFVTNMSVSGPATYTGNIQGNLYGPAANEVGAVFVANGAGGGSVGGVMVGAQSAAVVDSGASLANLPTASTFNTNESGYASPAINGTTSPNGLLQTGLTTVTYDPATKAYVVTGSTSFVPNGNNGTGYQNIEVTPLTTATLNAQTIDAANSNATFTAYAAPGFSARVFNAGASNPVIQLSYVSFVDITQSVPNNATNVTYPADHFLVFGIPASQVPTTGTASYTGVVYGRGSDTTLTTGDVALSGTGQLTADFGASTLTSTLALKETPASTGVTQTIGNFGFAGTISGANFKAAATSIPGGGSPNGTMLGSFYGPAAAEVGAAFTITLPGTTYSAPGNALSGVFVGKKG